ncbi:CoA transferase [Sphaerisporangium viridialbum]|uniref:CoA transferase n=1 Tax=Sphaerisporangium viridialbum TaxID=46189 RepID=UPI003C70F34B
MVCGVGKVIEELGAEVGVELPPVHVTGQDPVLPSTFKVGTAAAACVGAVAAAVALLRAGPDGGGAERGDGDEVEVATEVRESAVAFRDERYFRVDGKTAVGWAPLSGDYRTADGWVRLHCNFDHHRDAALHVLDLSSGADEADLAEACARRTAQDIEQAVTEAGGCAAAMRSRSEWQAHPQGRAVAELPLIGLDRLGRVGAEAGTGDLARAGAGVGLDPLGGAAAGVGAGGLVSAGAECGSGGRDGAAVREGRWLEGVRVVDLTRVIAGPVATRTLAAYGAEVLRVGAAHLPEVPGLVISTAFGKRSCELDLRTEAGAARFRELVAGADVVVQSYRPGALAALGFGPEELAAIRPGIICVDISAYGSRGPWAGRRGFDSLVQMACGIAHEGGAGQRPVPLPAQVLDHATGWLAALGAIAGLLRREAEGGSWHVEVALARTALWLDGLGRVGSTGHSERRSGDALDREAGLLPGGGVHDRQVKAVAGLIGEEVADLLEEMDSPFGRLTYVRAPGRVGGVRPYWSSPPPRRGAHPPAWL